MAIVAVALGAALYALAMPPFDLAPAAWLTIVPLLLAVRSRPAASSFALGALYGFLSAWGVTWWLAQAVGRYFGSGVLLGAFAMSAAYALAVGTAFGLFAAGASLLLRGARRWAALLGVPALWVACELLRGRLLGQPWALLGYTQHAHPALLQIAALTGVYGVSFVVALGNLALALAAAQLRSGERPAAVVRGLALPASVVVAVWLGGALVLPAPAELDAKAPRVALVQTNVEPAFVWTRAFAERELAAHLTATEALRRDERPALVVWPENAVPRYLESDPGLAATLAGAARRARADLLFGAPRHERGRIFNSVRLITADGRNGGVYDKQHLVLFAERGPIAAPAPAIPDESPRSFSAGRAPGLLWSFVPLGVSICHEILYPEVTHRAVRWGAALLVNVSNDGWLDGGYGAASRQHFAMAALRAVEARRYLVRATTTGVSGVIDPWGRVVEALPPGVSGSVVVPVVGIRGLTPYVRLGDVFATGCALFALLAVAASRSLPVRRRRLALRPVP